jgi:hypothetical protein
LWYCQPHSGSLPTLLDAKKAVLSRSLFRDSIDLSVVVEFVIVGSVTCMPAHRVFRHTWRDSNRANNIYAIRVVYKICKTI